MLVRSIRSSFSACRFFCSSSLSKNIRNASELNKSLGTKLLRLRNPSIVPNVIAKWKEEGHAVSSDEITKTVCSLMKHKRNRQALMICDSMVEQKIIVLKPQDYANHMWLIANDQGSESAEIYFEGIPEAMKCYITYSALLNIYVQREEIVKAEALMEKMAGRSFLKVAQPYIHMMSLYISIGQIDKAEEMINEARKHIKPIAFNYNMWLIACASKNNIEAADLVFSEMKKAKVEPDWKTHSTLAELYIKNKLFEKAGFALKDMEKLLLTGGRKAYSSLIRMHGSIGNRDEVARIWDEMKLKFGKMRDFEYSLVVSTLLKADSFEKSEEICSEWAAHFKGGKVPKLLSTTGKLMKNAKDAKNSLTVEEAKFDEKSCKVGEECYVLIQWPLISLLLLSDSPDNECPLP